MGGTAALHVAAELMTFVVWISRGWHRLYHQTMCRWPLRILYSRRDQSLAAAHEAVCCRKSIQYGNRLLLTCMTLVMIALRCCLLHRYSISEDSRKLSNEEFLSKLLGIVIMLGSELLAYAIIIVCNRKFSAGRPFLTPWLWFGRQNRHCFVM